MVTFVFSASINFNCSSSSFRLCVAAADAADFSSQWRFSKAAFNSLKCLSIASSAAVAAVSNLLSSLATASLAEPSLLKHSLALYNRISDILFKAMENGTTVWSQGVSLWGPSAQCRQKTQSQVSQKRSSRPGWELHWGITSLLCRAIKSSSWLTRNDGGKACTPPLGMVISSRQIGHRKQPASLVCEAAIRVRQCKQTVCEHCKSFGVCSPPS